MSDSGYGSSWKDGWAGLIAPGQAFPRFALWDDGVVVNRADDWLRQGERDLEQARASWAEERHEWACFAAQQAAEKAVKALHLACHQEARGQVVAKLLAELPEAVTVPDDLVEQAKVLDNFYVSSRYPNGHPEGAPFEHYGPLQSEQAVDHARAIIEFVRPQMA